MKRHTLYPILSALQALGLAPTTTCAGACGLLAMAVFCGRTSPEQIPEIFPGKLSRL